MPVNFGDTFLAFCSKYNLGKWTKDIEQKEWFEFSFDEFHFLKNKGFVSNGTTGGLIIGPLHIHGGIQLLKPLEDRPAFIYMGEMEGWEYLTYPLSSIEIANEFVEINSLHKNGVTNMSTEFESPISCNLVDTLNSEISILLISHLDQFIINRFSTANHIDRILEIENRNKP